MNWRKSNAELSKLYDRSPWLYMIEWCERLERCIMHLDGGALGDKLEAGEAFMEAEQLRAGAADLLRIADRLEDRARLREKIAALRSTDGRTPEEAAAFTAKADALEAAMNEEQHHA